MKTNWITIDDITEDNEYETKEWQIDYAKEKGIYRISEFLDDHWQNEIIFNEYGDKAATLTKIIKLFELGEPIDKETGFECIKSILKEEGWINE